MVQLNSCDTDNISVIPKAQLSCATIAVLLCWIIVVSISRQPGQWALVTFLLCSALMVVATAFIVWRYHYAQRYISFKWILLSAVLLRLISLAGEPLFEDDYYRYMWDGYQTVTTHDPYTLAPAEFFDADDVPELFEPILSLINYPEIATVYGPVTQWIFALGYLLEPAAVWPLQLLASVADLLLIVLLYRLGAGNALLLYAWSPLILKEFSLTAHPDIYAILAVVASIWAVAKRQVWLAGVTLALGFGAKVFAILALPYLLSCRWSLRFWVVLCGFFAVTLALITVSFGTVKIWVPDGLQAMADSWLFNSAVYLLLLEYLPFQAIKVLLLAMFTVFIACTGLKRLHSAWKRTQTASLETQQYHSDTQPSGTWMQSTDAFRGDWLFMLFLLALPVINPWYVAWILPFAALYPRWWSWATSVLCLLAYWTGHNTGAIGAAALELPTSVIAIEYTTVILVAFIAWLVCRQLPRYHSYTKF